VSTDAVLIIGVGVVLALPLAWRVVARRFDPFEPIVIFALAWGVMFVVRPAAILIRDDTNFYGVDIGSTLDRAMFLALLGAVAFVVGYESSLGARAASRLRSPPEDFSRARVVAGAVVVTALGVLTFVVLVIESGGLSALEILLGGRSDELSELIEGSGTYLWYGSLLVIPATLAVVGLAFDDRQPRMIVAALVLVALALLRTVPVGSRVFLLILVGGVLVFAYVRRGRRPGAVVLVVGLACALLASSVLLNLRYSENRSSLAGVLSGLASTPSRVFTPLIKGPDAEMAPALAGALQAVPEELSYRYGGAIFGDLVVRPIPAQLWADKPEPPGHEVVGAVWPEPQELGNFDPALTPLLFLFWDFSLAGVVVGMALLGATVRGLYEYLLLHRDNVLAQLVFAAGLWYLVAALRHDPVTVFVWGMLLFVPLVAIFALAAQGRFRAVLPAVSSGES
jgi:hypothetical protein